MSTEKTQLQEAVNAWKEMKIHSCVMIFDCGGDSMGDYEFDFYDENNELIDDSNENIQFLNSYFEDQVFKEVEFYEVSDGHYIGESGTVTITLEAVDDEEEYFAYDKESESEYSETIVKSVNFEVTDKEFEFLKKVKFIEGGDHTDVLFTYEKDCVLSDDELDIEKSMGESLNDFVESYNEWDDAEGDMNEDYYGFTLSLEGVDSKDDVKVEIERSFTVFQTNDL